MTALLFNSRLLLVKGCQQSWGCRQARHRTEQRQEGPLQKKIAWQTPNNHSQLWAILNLTDLVGSIVEQANEARALDVASYNALVTRAVAGIPAR